MARGKHRMGKVVEMLAPAPVVEAMTPAEALLPLVSRIDSAPDGLTALRQALHVRQVLERQIISGLVGVCRGEGATWDQLAEVMGVRRQAVWQRYGTTRGPERFFAEQGRAQVTLSEEEYAEWQSQQNRKAFELLQLVERGEMDAEVDDVVVKLFDFDPTK